MLVAVGLVVAALACSGCSNQEAADDDVDPGGSLVSGEGRIAFTHAAKLDWSDVPSLQADVHAIDADGSGERRLQQAQPRTLRKLADALGVEPRELMKEEE